MGCCLPRLVAVPYLADDARIAWAHWGAGDGGAGDGAARLRDRARRRGGQDGDGRIEFKGSYRYTDIITSQFQPSSTSQTLRWDEVTVAQITGARIRSSRTTLTLSGQLDAVTQSSGDEHCKYSAYAPLISSISPRAVADADGSGKLAEIIASAAIPDHVAAQVRQSGTATGGDGSPSTYCTTPTNPGADILLSDNFSPAPFQGVDGQKFAAAADLGATLPAGRVRVTVPGHASASALSTDEKASRSLTTSLTVETDRGPGSGGPAA